MSLATQSMRTGACLKNDPAARELYRNEEIRAATMEIEFLRKHAVREFQNTSRNVLTFLKSQGASDVAARVVADRLGRFGAHDGLFDHGQLFGRDGRPTLLVGHPYTVEEADQPLIRRISSLGFRVIVSDESFHGFGSCQVLVTARKPDEAGADPEPEPTTLRRRTARGAVWTEGGLRATDALSARIANLERFAGEVQRHLQRTTATAMNRGR